MKFDIRKFITLSLKYWYLYVLGVVVFAGLIMWKSKRSPDKVEVTASVYIPSDSPASSMLMEMAQAYSFGDFGSTSVDNEIAMMYSHSVFMATVKELGLNTSYYAKDKYGNWVTCQLTPPVKLTCAPALNDTIRTGVVFDIKAKGDGFEVKAVARKKTVANGNFGPMPFTVKTIYGDFTFDRTAAYNSVKDKAFIVKFGSYNGAAQNYAQKVSILAPSKKTDFISLSFITTEPKFGEKLLDTLLDNYSRQGITMKNDRSRAALRQVDERLATLAQELAASEQHIEAFKKANNLTDVLTDAGTLVGKSNALDNALLAAQTECELIKLARAFLENPANKYELMPMLPNGNASSEINAYNQLILERMKLMGSAKENNLSVRQLSDGIDAMRGNIMVTIDRALANAELRLGELEKENAETSGKLGSLPTLEKEYEDMKRTQLVQNEIYIFMLKQKEELMMAIRRSQPATVVVDDAYVKADPIGLSGKMKLVLAVILGCMFPAAWIAVFRMRNPVMWSTQEIAELSKAPVAGQIASGDKRDETLRMLRTNVIQILEGCGGKTVMVTSAGDDPSRAETALSLARSLSGTGRSVVMVETDPDALPADAAGVKVMKPDAGDRDYWARADARKRLDELKETNDYVVIDTPSARGNSEAFVLAPECDLTLMTVRAGVSKADDVEFANSVYAGGRLPRIALVATGVSDKKLSDKML